MENPSRGSHVYARTVALDLHPAPVLPRSGIEKLRISRCVVFRQSIAGGNQSTACRSRDVLLFPQAGHLLTAPLCTRHYATRRNLHMSLVLRLMPRTLVRASRKTVSSDAA
jgi:hypothetical protein